MVWLDRPTSDGQPDDQNVPPGVGLPCHAETHCGCACGRAATTKHNKRPNSKIPIRFMETFPEKYSVLLDLFKNHFVVFQIHANNFEFLQNTHA